jgi:hypothetical protein
VRPTDSGFADLLVGGPGFCFGLWRWNGIAYAHVHNEPQAPRGCDNRQQPTRANARSAHHGYAVELPEVAVEGGYESGRMPHGNRHDRGVGEAERGRADGTERIESL